MASRPSLQLPYDQWVGRQEEHSQRVQRGYVEEAAAHNERMAKYRYHVAYMTSKGEVPFLRMPVTKRSWVWDPMMVMLCRKDCPTPSEEKDEFEGDDESEEDDESEGEDHFEEATGHGGPSNMGYSSMPRS